jgi:hypothetical protein
MSAERHLEIESHPWIEILEPDLETIEQSNMAFFKETLPKGR